jgi:hypothetical protein
MKKIFLICLSAGFISNGFAQSSVADVPANKIKPAYENAPATKSQAASTAQKVVTPQPVLNSVGLNAHDQPNLKPAPVVTKPVEVTKAESTAPSRLVSISANKGDLAPAPVTDQKPVTTTSVAPVNTKPVAVQADKTIPGTLVSIPIVNISTSDVQPATVPANTNKMPEQKISQDVPKAEPEIAPSVPPTAPKAPAAATKQGGN